MSFIFTYKLSLLINTFLNYYIKNDIKKSVFIAIRNLKHPARCKFQNASSKVMFLCLEYVKEKALWD